MMEDWVKQALALGFTAAAPVNPAKLTVREDVRAMCAADRCHAYNRNWTCPPACGTLEECSARIARCTSGILVQTMGPLEDSFDYEGMMELEQRHLDQFHKFADLVRKTDPDALCLGSGGCRICKTCAHPQPCRFPSRACSSMEAYGLVVSEACAAGGLAYYYGTGTLAYTACILFRHE